LPLEDGINMSSSWRESGLFKRGRTLLNIKFQHKILKEFLDEFQSSVVIMGMRRHHMPGIVKLRF
jgi:hypothetical protein